MAAIRFRLRHAYRRIDRAVHLTILTEILCTMKIFCKGHVLIETLEETLISILKSIENGSSLRSASPSKIAIPEDMNNPGVLEKTKYDCYEVLEDLVRRRDVHLTEVLSLNECYGKNLVEIYQLILGTLKIISSTWKRSEIAAEDTQKLDQWDRVIDSDHFKMEMKFDHYFLYLIGIARFIIFDMKQFDDQNSDRRKDLMSKNVLNYASKLFLSTFKTEEKCERFCRKHLTFLPDLKNKQKIAKILHLQLSLLVLFKSSLVNPSCQPFHAIIKLVKKLSKKEKIHNLSMIFPEKYELSPKSLVEKYLLLYARLANALHLASGEDTRSFEHSLMDFLIQQSVFTCVSEMMVIFELVENFWLSFDTNEDCINYKILDRCDIPRLSALLNEVDNLIDFVKNFPKEQYSSRMLRTIQDYLGELHWKIKSSLKLKGRWSELQGGFHAGIEVLISSSDLAERVNLQQVEEMKYSLHSKNNLGAQRQNMKNNFLCKQERNELNFIYNLFPDGVTKSERENATKGIPIFLKDLLDIMSIIYYLVVAYQTSVVMKTFHLDDPLMKRIASSADSLVQYLKKRTKSIPSLQLQQNRIEKTFISSLKKLHEWLAIKKSYPGSFEYSCFPAGDGEEQLSFSLMVADKTLQMYKRSISFIKKDACDYANSSRQDYHLILKSITLLLKKTCIKPETLDDECRMSLKELHDNLISGGMDKFNHFQAWADFLSKVVEQKHTD